MRSYALPLTLACALLSPALSIAAPPPDPIPAYTPDGHLLLPHVYREWIFLSSGIDMTYTPTHPTAIALPSSHSTFENVFVNPDSYRSFLATGTWPDKTVLVLEVRGAETDASINKAGKTQGPDLHAIEVHVKDTARFPATLGWGFFNVDHATGTGKLIPPPATCYTCHQEHAAVDTTFTQFYPTLLPIAQAKHTLSPAYRKELSIPDPSKPPTPAATP